MNQWVSLEARAGIEPANKGFADLPDALSLSCFTATVLDSGPKSVPGAIR
jgi:hypothetical protein